MKIINFDFNFTFEILDDYKEIAKSDYYPCGQKVGEGIRTISINRDDNFKDEDEYYGVIAHKPDNDAYMTMLILKEMIQRKNTSISKIIEENPHIKYHSLDGYTL